MMRIRIFLFLGFLFALGLGYFLYPYNQQMTVQLLDNLSKGKPAMQGVAYHIPFLRYEAKVVVPPKYPESIVFAEDARLKFRSLDGDYWGTQPFALQGETRDEATAYQAHLRFKFNPPDDPIHPGYSILATQSDLHTIAFLKAKGSDFYALEAAPIQGWTEPNSAEIPAVWNLEAGNIIWIKLVSPTILPPKEKNGKETRVEKTTYAKFFIKKLSREDVVFDYIYQTDGSNHFPRPQN